MNVSSFPSYGVYISQLILFASFVLMLVTSTQKPFFFKILIMFKLHKSVLKWFRVGNYQEQLLCEYATPKPTS